MSIVLLRQFLSSNHLVNLQAQRFSYILKISTTLKSHTVLPQKFFSTAKGRLYLLLGKRVGLAAAGHKLTKRSRKHKYKNIWSPGANEVVSPQKHEIRLSRPGGANH